MFLLAETEMKGKKTKMVSDHHLKPSASGSPWLSIIIPIYNAEKYLSRCIDSILSQSFTDYELILVDDGSQDNSSKICLQYAENDRRISYYRKENGGGYQARIFGAEHCYGEYVTFCDADDYYSTRLAFETIHSAVLESHCAALQFGYYKKYNHLKRRVDFVKERLLAEREDFYSREYPKLLCSFWDSAHLSPNVWNKVYHRSLLSGLPSHLSAEGAFWGDDLVLNLALLQDISSMLFLPDALYAYQQGSGGTSAFRISAMDDLDFIKRSQLHYLDAREDQSDKEKIERILYSETAGWFFLWVRQVTDCLDETQIRRHIERILQLPSFLASRLYYEKHTEDETLSASLLRKADPQLYIGCARKAGKTGDTSIKGRIRSILKKIYVSI